MKGAIQAVSLSIKSLDSNHMVTTGPEDIYEPDHARRCASNRRTLWVQ